MGYGLWAMGYGRWAMGNLQDQGPEKSVEKGIRRDLDISFHQAVQHQPKNAHHGADGDVPPGLPRRKGTNSQNRFHQKKNE